MLFGTLFAPWELWCRFLALARDGMARDGMAKERQQQRERDPVRGAEMLRRVFPLLARLAESGTQRDQAGNRQLLFRQYAGLMLVGLFNPVLQSARALVAASGLKKVRQLTGGKKVSLGSFSEATAVFEPQLLEGIVRQLRSQVQHDRHLQSRLSGRAAGEVPDKLIERLIAVDGSVLTALPQVVGRLGTLEKGQWRLPAQVRVLDGTLVASPLTKEPSAKGRAERDVMAHTIAENQIDMPASSGNHLFLMGRGYRSADLFNKIHAAGHDDLCRLNRTDGRLADEPVSGRQGRIVTLPPLSSAARELGVVADELIMLGGRCGASKIGRDHPLRRITLIPPAERTSSARQGRVRTDQSGHEELVLATPLLDLPAEQIVLLYEYRWQVELFFRFVKHVLNCDKLLTARTAGVEIQLDCAIIASLLLALATGGNLTRRNFEIVCLDFSGWADEDERLESLAKPPP